MQEQNPVISFLRHPTHFPSVQQTPEVWAELDHTLGGGGFVNSQRDNNGSNVREADSEGSMQADRGLSLW